VPRLTARGARRWLVLHASHLTSTSGSQIAVIIEPASRAELEPVTAASQGLTTREAETMPQVLHSLPAKTIPRTLPVTLNSTNDHIKAIFAKAGAGRRGDLMATVFRDHSMPGL